MQIIMIIAGTLSVFLGILGIFLPLLPTTPFLLLAAICYAKGSEKLHNALLNNRLCGSYIRNYREGKGIPLKQKVLTIILLWLSLGLTAFIAVNSIWLKIVLLIIGSGVTIHLIKMKTFRTGKKYKVSSDFNVKVNQLVDQMK